MFFLFHMSNCRSSDASSGLNQEKKKIIKTAPGPHKGMQNLQVYNINICCGLARKGLKLKALIIKLETINLISGNSTEWSSIRPVILH